MQINPKAGLTFANGLRSMLRADPDIIMVGEIRDKETAQIAVEAALTGHLVLSTLHTNDAPGAIARLIEMGVEPFLVSSAVELRARPAPRAARCATASRRSCCRGDAVRANGYDVDGDDDHGVRAGRLRALRRHGLQGPRRPLRGHAGHRRDPQARRRPRVGRRDRARRRPRAGMRPLRAEGLDKVLAGLTSFAELARVTV